MAIKKTELYSSLWQSCDELRGGMDASQYKDYVLTFLFMKYVSDKYAGDPYGLIEVPQGGSFTAMVALKGDPEIGDKINKIIGRLAEANDLRGVIDIADFNDEDKLGRGKEMVDRLSKLVAIFEGIDLRANRAGGDDLLGDAYEYLMRHFATESGKSKGQFYTPAEVSRILAQLVGINSRTSQDMTAYDPTCGSGSLLLKVADEAPNGLSLYGQEMDNATAALAKMNMILHDNPTAEIWQANTLASPHWLNEDGGLKTFDFAVANFPFSYKSWLNGVNPADDEFQRFEYGIPPSKNGDYAFLLHTLKSLKSTGHAAVILPHGVLFRGNTEGDIRRSLIRQGYFKGIIGLPPNLFYGTGIPACILVLDKEGGAERPIFMIDASRGFMKDGNKNRLRERDIHKIVDVFRKQTEILGYARLVPYAEIAGKNEFNLNIPRYIDGSEPEDIQDLYAHLNGGIPQRDIDELEAYWQVLPTLRRSLFRPLDHDGYSAALVPANEVKAAILEHPQFTAFQERTLAIFNAWWTTHTPRLQELNIGADPKALIHDLAEDLLACFTRAALVDKYAIYQLLLDYWAEAMGDDVYLIAQDGWAAGNILRELVAERGTRSRETPDLVINRKKWKADLIPPQLLVTRYFSKEQARLERLASKIDQIGQELAALVEEHSGEEGLLEEATNDKGSLTKTGLRGRLKDIIGDPDFAEELALLEQCQELLDQDSEAKKDHKEAQARLDALVFAKYPDLSLKEIKELVIGDKWQATLQEATAAEIERVSQGLANRVKELEERYDESLPQLKEEFETLAKKVDEHLKRMGLTW